MRRNFIIILTIAVLSLTAQPAGAQKWLETVDKGLSAVDKLFGSKKSKKNKKTEGQTDGRTDGQTGTTASGVPTIHETADTKVYTIDGNVEYMGDFQEGYACVWKADHSWLVINTKGEKVFEIPSGYYVRGIGGSTTFTITYPDNSDLFLGFNDGRLVVYSKAKMQAIIYDHDFNVVKTINDIRNASGYANGMAIIENLDYGGTYIDLNGNVLSKTMPGDAMNFRLYGPVDGLSRLNAGDSFNGGKWGFVNSKCQWVIKPQFSNAHAFSNGLALVKDDGTGKWGYIDEKGNWAIRPIYSIEPTDFCCGVAGVTDKSGRHYLIDKSGNIVKQVGNEYYNVTDYDYILYTVSGGKDIWVMDSTLTKVAKLPIQGTVADNLLSCNEKYLVFKDNSNNSNAKIKVFDLKGNELLEFDEGFGRTYKTYFCDGISSYNGYYNHVKDGSRFYFNVKGEIIAKFQDTQF